MSFRKNIPSEFSGGFGAICYLQHPLDKVIGHLLGHHRVLFVERMRCQKMSNPPGSGHQFTWEEREREGRERERERERGIEREREIEREGQRERESGFMCVKKRVGKIILLLRNKSDVPHVITCP